MQVEDFSLADARDYNAIVRDGGVWRKSFDHLIGVRAVRLGFTLVARGARHLVDVPGVRVEDWTMPL